MGISRVKLAYSLSVFRIWPIKKNPTTTTAETATTTLSTQRPTGIKKLANNRKSHRYPQKTISEPYLYVAKKNDLAKQPSQTKLFPKEHKISKTKRTQSHIFFLSYQNTNKTYPQETRNFFILLIKKRVVNLAGKN